MTMLDRDKCDLIQQLWEADPETLAQITEIAVVGSNKMTMLGAKQTLRERLAAGAIAESRGPPQEVEEGSRGEPGAEAAADATADAGRLLNLHGRPAFHAA
eukprot:CAMPEP_0183579612 /NCGR_PEP_ID=MMETSP0371-20130417/144162_1 /TAXON_ID=268820 /ORGANISM="Peridinium aciculiferum, Strain PAER-2" /LENGTH=100 /DNA_ID=CAMNT_0025790137 /DNA_START=70 /DNA_END=367 /DNA_ORIENTATION=+